VVRGINEKLIEVESVGNLKLGDHIRLRWKPDSLEEVATVAKIDSNAIELSKPLLHAFPAGTIVDLQPGLHPDAPAEPPCYDSALGATDHEGIGCDYYGDYSSSCGLNDDVDFTAKDMCCYCGGGSPTVPTTTRNNWAFDKRGGGGGSIESGSNEAEDAVFGGASSGNHQQEIMALVLLVLAVLTCLGCIVVAWLVALEKRKENKAHSKGRELAYTDPGGADQSFDQSDATSFHAAQEAPASPQGYRAESHAVAAAAVPTQIMPQMNPYNPQQYPHPAFDGYGNGGLPIQGAPMGGQNQYYDPAPEQRRYFG